MTNDNHNRGDATGATCVGDLRKLLRDGEDRVFEKTKEPTGDEPVFYKVSKRGELDHLPRWLNRLPLVEHPQPGIMDMPPIPIRCVERYDFDVDAARVDMGDFYRISTGIFLITQKLRDLLLRLEPGSIDVAPATVRTRDEDRIDDYVVCMPTRVLDAVDIDKTDVLVTRQEVAPGTGAFSTHVRYDHGYTLRSDIADDMTSFVERYTNPWLWRDSLIEAVAEIGAKGFRFYLTRSPRTPTDIYL